jgi:hypothetical protein
MRWTLAIMLAIVASALLVLVSASPAFAGQAASGELFFYPCDGCHPVASDASTADLPNEFAGHRIVLEGHDQLGEGEDACYTCHADAAEDPGMLKLADGSLIDITGDVSQVCYRCHFDKYADFVVGDHGHLRDGCTDAGCHDPHTPMYIYAEPLLPFTGSGFQFRGLAEREPFMPLAKPPISPVVHIPTWFTILTTIGLLAAVGQVGLLIRGRQKS